MKRLLTFLLAAIIVIGGLMPMEVYGENGYDKKLEEAIIKVKKLFQIPDEYDKFDQRINSHGEYTNFYLNWSDSKGKLPEIQVSTDIEGNIISFYKYFPNYQEPKTKISSFTREEGMEKALEFIGKVDKDIQGSIKIRENYSLMTPMDTDYRYEFTRYVNDIPYNDNSVSISLDKVTGEVTNYYANWERKQSFPSVDKIISLEEGKKAYIDNIGLKPMYKSTYQVYGIMRDKEKVQYYIAYTPLFPSKAIDAITGKPINISYFGPYTTDMAVAEKAEADNGLTPEEKEAVDKLTGILEISAIEKKAREILKIDEGFKLQSKYLMNSYKNPSDYIWALYFTKELEDNQIISLDTSLDAKTGELINFYKYTPFASNTKATITREKALDMAKEYLKKINPDKEKEVEYIPNEYYQENETNSHFHFIRKTNNIYVESDSINIGVDLVNQEIMSYSLDWYKGELPSGDNIISIDKAYEVLWNDIGYELIYANHYDYSKNDGQNTTIKLIYSLKQNKPAIISAKTGEILDYTGKPYRERIVPNYTDIDKSYAKDKIITLAEYGISIQGNEFKPSEKIKQKDFVYLLWKSINPYRIEGSDENDLAYKDFILQGYLTEKEKSPEKVVTKEEAIKLIIKVMKLDKVAEVEEIYSDIFKDTKDISKGLKGYMNIAYGLKIIVGDGKGNINPKYELKREDAANIIYNYLFN